MTDVIPTLLLLALPASGKSELRRYLASVPEDRAGKDFGLGRTLQLDDYPYVHFMRRIASELRILGADGVFFDSDEVPFTNAAEWGTLIHLVNEDYHTLEQPDDEPESAARWLVERIDRARAKVGLPPVLVDATGEMSHIVEQAIEAEARTFWEERHATITSDRAESTVVIEFARGGPEGAGLPLTGANGYQYSLGQLSSEILASASILYVWVTPFESRRRNLERARPGRDGDASILHHGVPETVMRQDYGTDDMMWLIEDSDRPGTVQVHKGDDVFHLPVAAFDNRVDKTSFLRDDPRNWPPESVAQLHGDLVEAFRQLQTGLELPPTRFE